MVTVGGLCLVRVLVGFFVTWVFFMKHWAGGETFLSLVFFEKILGGGLGTDCGHFGASAEEPPPPPAAANFDRSRDATLASKHNSPPPPQASAQFCSSHRDPVSTHSPPPPANPVCGLTS